MNPKIAIVLGGALILYLILRPRAKTSGSTGGSSPRPTDLQGSAPPTPSNLSTTISGMAPGTNVSSIFGSGRATYKART